LPLTIASPAQGGGQCIRHGRQVEYHIATTRGNADPRCGSNRPGGVARFPIGCVFACIALINIGDLDCFAGLGLRSLGKFGDLGSILLISCCYSQRKKISQGVNRQNEKAGQLTRLVLCPLFDDLLSLQPRANRSFQNLPGGRRKATINSVNHSSKQYLFPPGKDSP
jgi:hypothetical protein